MFERVIKDFNNEIKRYAYNEIRKLRKIFEKKCKKKSDFLKSLCEIMRNITYNDIHSNLKFKAYFFGSEFPNIFGSTYEYFITCFLSNIKSSEDFWNYADFFNLINHKLNRNVYEILGFYHLFCKIQKEIYEKDYNNFISIILLILDLFYLNHLDITKEFFIILGKNFNEEEYMDFLFYLNENYINKTNNNSYLSYYIMNFFNQIFKEKNKDINYLIEVLNHLNNIQEINRVFNQIFDITINSEKFYNKSENENISKIKELFKTEYYQNPEYSENIEKIISIKNTFVLLANTLIIRNYTYRKLKEMNSLTDTELMERFYLLFNADKQSMKSNYFSVKNTFNRYSDYKSKLKEVVIFINSFCKNILPGISDIYSEKENKFDNTIINNEHFFTEDKNFIDYYNLSKKYNIFSNSKFFLGIFECISSKKAKTLIGKFDLAFKEFQILKNFLLNGNIENKTLEKIIINLENIFDIENEINFLKTYFNVENVHENVKFTLENVIQKKVLEQPINNLIQLILDFQVHLSDYYYKLIKLQKKCDSSSNIISKELLNEIKKNSIYYK